MRVVVIGRGKVGRTLQRELLQAGVDSKLVAGRFTRLPRTRTVYLLAVPDARLREVAATLAPHIDPDSVVLHCAGARDQHELAALQARGAGIGVFHPLVSFASARARYSLRGATFTTYGDRRAIAVARKLATRLHARVVVLRDAPGPAYHAAAALVANGAVALAHLGARVLRQVGFTQREAERGLATLLSSVSHNVATVGLPRALTGPVARGDAPTLVAHVGALAKLERELAQAYLALQPAVLATARAAGLDPQLDRAVGRTLNRLGAAPQKARPRGRSHVDR